MLTVEGSQCTGPVNPVDEGAYEEIAGRQPAYFCFTGSLVHWLWLLVKGHNALVK